MFKLSYELETELQWQDLQPVLREECDLNITPGRQVLAQSGISVLFPDIDHLTKQVLHIL